MFSYIIWPKSTLVTKKKKKKKGNERIKDQTKSGVDNDIIDCESGLKSSVLALQTYYKPRILTLQMIAWEWERKRETWIQSEVSHTGFESYTDMLL